MDDLPIYLILPLVLGMLYSVAAMAFKRAMAEGMDIGRIIFYSNLATVILLVPLLVLVSKPQPGAFLYQPLITAVAFFVGIALNVAAIWQGDVSVATPILGIKVLFVAFFTIIILDEPLRPSLWIGAVIAGVAFAMLRGPANRPSHRFWLTVFLAVGSSSAFALCDVFFQLWTRIWGVGLFIPMVFAIVCVLSFTLLTLFPAPGPAVTARSGRWLMAGCVLNGLQTLGMVICVGLFRHPNAATAINIVYNSRGIWSVLLVWVLGHWFGNMERGQGSKIMVFRLAGSALMISAIVLILRHH
jgi:drug/metabolite transporter (DMT)-like permease